MNKKLIAKLARAAQIPPLVYREVAKIIVPGMSELEIADYLKQRLKYYGATRPAFRVIVASGYRSAIPHGWATLKKIKKGELIVIDFGALLNGVRSDYTRTLVVGKPNKIQKEMLTAVAVAKQRAIKRVRAGVTCAEVDAAARDYLDRRGLAQYFIHTTGHGIGRRTHEAPKISANNMNKLKAGMVITIEPGIYIKKLGGVRIEDMVLVTENGYTILTR